MTYNRKNGYNKTDITDNNIQCNYILIIIKYKSGK